MALPIAKASGDHSLQLKITAGAALIPGQVVAAYGPLAGVVMGCQNITSGDEVVVALDGNWEIDCATGTTASAGDNAFYNTSTGLIVTAGGADIIWCGTFAKAKTSGQLKAYVHLNGGEALGCSLYIPSAVQQSLAAGGGAVNVTTYYTAGASDAGGDAWTLADGVRVGQLKKIKLITDGGGDATLTPANFTSGTTITFADAGDTAVLMWDGSGWVALEVSNDADGATAPVIA